MLSTLSSLTSSATLHRVGLTLSSCLTLVAVQLASAEPQADSAPKPSQSAEPPSSDLPTSALPKSDIPKSDIEPLGLRVALGVSGGLSGSFLQKPKDELYYLGEASAADIVYPGFGGLGGGFGAHVDLAWRFISLTTGYSQSYDQAEGKADGATLTVSQQTAHVPLVLRFELPSESVRPSIFGGVDWVSPSEAKVESSSKLITSPYQGVKSEDYRAWTFGIGVDFMINERLRLPLRFYGVLNPSPKDSLNDAFEAEIVGDQVNRIDLRGEWDWQAGVTFGVSYDVYRR